MESTKHDPIEWEDFEAAARRPIEQHIRNSFIHTHKPVLDDDAYRSFDMMEAYRQWCKANLPVEYLPQPIRTVRTALDAPPRNV
ncbi:MAG: hypothetical protein WCB12_11460 [Bryobacteraceae bacterium]